MRLRVFMAMALSVGAVTPVFGQQLVAAAKRVPVATLDSTLPAIPLERWLAGLPGVRGEITWEENDCGEGGDGREAPTCVAAIVPLGRDSSAHLSLVMSERDGTAMPPIVWDLSIGAGYAFTGFKTLRDWARRLGRE